MPLNKCFPCLQFQSEEVITKLDLSNTVLTDIFPEVWQYERTLEELYLTSTRINQLPPQLFYCQSLRILMVNNNSLESIPNAVGSLRQLQYLNLNRNLIANVPENIKTCKNLTHLDLSCNNLQRLPDAITCLISLQELLLNETYLEFLPANFGRLVNLKILELRLNNLITLPKSMARLSSLQRIDIGGNEFTELPEVIGELKQLRELWIDFNQIRRISPNVAKLRELQHFEANGNLIDSLPNEVSHWRNIEVLSVCTNSLEALPFSIGMMRSLVTFKCESNELRELPDSISNLENLEELVLSHNKLLRLPATVGMLRKLRFLFADDNELRSLPEELCSCSQLSVLSVSRNRIAELPQNIGHLTQLKVLNLVSNQIATLPVSILSLVNLTSLWISDNQSQPLVPLQYLDANTKTQLTCFMLPQVAFRMSQHQHQPQKPFHEDFTQPQEEREYARQLLEQQHQLQQEQQQHLYASRSSGATVCTSPSRRICFAEEATILTTLPQATKAGATRNGIRSSVVASARRRSAAASAPSVADASPALEEHLGVRLMRSPTPYPKELRLMAKYVRNGQKLAQKSAPLEPINVKEARVMSNNINCDTISLRSNDVQSPRNGANSPDANGHPIESAVLYTSAAHQYSNHNNDVTYCMDQQLQQQQQQQQRLISSIPPNAHYNNTEQQEEKHTLQSASGGDEVGSSGGGQQFYAAYYVGPSNMSAMCENSVAHNYKIVSQAQEQQQQQQDPEQHALSSYYLSSNEPPLLEPPPYHIARVFTKKTPEDLTNYDTMRSRHQYQQQQRQQELLLQKQQQQQQLQEEEEELSEYLRADAPDGQELQQEIFNATSHRDQTLRSGDRGDAIGDCGAAAAAAAEMNSNCDVYQQNRSVTAASAKLQVSPSDYNAADEASALMFDHQNNVLDEQSEDNMQMQQTMHQLEQRLEHQQLNGSLSQLSECSSNSLSSNAKCYNSSGRNMGKRTPWLFGVHKNPTVKQVTIKWEGHIGFEVTNAPNKEGIYVASTVPNTPAARLLNVHDKLLEVDGYDCTNLKISDARSILLNAGAVINVMLSRK